MRRGPRFRVPLRDGHDRQRGQQRGRVFRGRVKPPRFATLAAAGIDTVIEALRQVGIPYGLARKLMLVAALVAEPHGHADSVQTLDLDARREIRDMAAELGVDADI